MSGAGNQVTIFFDFLTTLLICFVLLSAPARRSMGSENKLLKSSTFILSGLDPRCEGLSLNVNVVDPMGKLTSFRKLAISGQAHVPTSTTVVLLPGTVPGGGKAQVFLTGVPKQASALDCLSQAYSVQYRIDRGAVKNSPLGSGPIDLRGAI